MPNHRIVSKAESLNGGHICATKMTQRKLLKAHHWPRWESVHCLSFFLPAAASEAPTMSFREGGGRNDQPRPQSLLPFLHSLIHFQLFSFAQLGCDDRLSESLAVAARTNKIHQGGKEMALSLATGLSSLSLFLPIVSVFRSGLLKCGSGGLRYSRVANFIFSSAPSRLLIPLPAALCT